MSEELDIEALRDGLAAARRYINELEAALEEIALADGPEAVDRLTHAENTIEAMVEVAERALGRWR